MSGGKPSGASARVVLADDHDLARASLRSLLSGERGVEVVGEATNGEEALELNRLLKPDLILADVHMPVLDGLAVTRSVKRESLATRVVIVTLDASPNRLLEALKAGADAYLLKGTSKRMVVDVVRQAIAGQPLLQSELASYLVLSLQSSPSAWSNSFSEPLTATELGVLQLCADGRSTAEIARALELKRRVLSGYIEQMLAKLGVVRS
jgi:DNA-binding NarL/FixJ family response regulator